MSATTPRRRSARPAIAWLTASQAPRAAWAASLPPRARSYTGWYSLLATDQQVEVWIEDGRLMAALLVGGEPLDGRELARENARTFRIKGSVWQGLHTCPTWIIHESRRADAPEARKIQVQSQDLLTPEEARPYS